MRWRSDAIIHEYFGDLDALSTYEKKRKQQRTVTVQSTSRGSSLSLEQLGLPASICKKARASGLIDVAAVAQQSDEALEALGFTDRQRSIVSSRLALIGRVAPVAQRQVEGDGISRENVFEAPASPSPRRSIVDDDQHEETLEEADLVIPDFGNDLFALPTLDRRSSGDDSRALRSASKATTTAAGRPTLHHPRVIDLLDSITMSVEDVAFLLNRSRDALYDALRRDPTFLPTQRVGQGISVLSQPFLRQIGLK